MGDGYDADGASGKWIPLVRMYLLTGIKGGDRSRTDFLRMLRGRQQALTRRETEERLSKKGETRDKPGPADKKDSDAGEPVSGRFRWRLLRQTQAVS